MVLIIASIGFFSCSESPEDYNKRAFAVADSISSSCDLCFAVATLKQEVWREAIYDNYYTNPLTKTDKKYVYEFSEALGYFDADFKSRYEILEEKSKLIDSLYITIKDHPEKSAAIFSNIKELLSLHGQALNMATKSEGSYKTYSANVDELSQKYKDIMSKINIDKK